jgi:hypothetical protein
MAVEDVAVPLFTVRNVITNSRNHGTPVIDTGTVWATDAPNVTPEDDVPYRGVSVRVPEAPVE